MTCLLLILDLISLYHRTNPATFESYLLGLFCDTGYDLITYLSLFNHFKVKFKEKNIVQFINDNKR